MSAIDGKTFIVTLALLAAAAGPRILARIAAGDDKDQIAAEHDEQSARLWDQVGDRGPCACWSQDIITGHEGHCCLRDTVEHPTDAEWPCGHRDAAFAIHESRWSK